LGDAVIEMYERVKDYAGRRKLDIVMKM